MSEREGAERVCRTQACHRLEPNWQLFSCVTSSRLLYNCLFFFLSGFSLSLMKITSQAEKSQRATFVSVLRLQEAEMKVFFICSYSYRYHESARYTNRYPLLFLSLLPAIPKFPASFAGGAKWCQVQVVCVINQLTAVY